MGFFIIYKNSLNKFYFVFRKNNNDIGLTGEKYATKKDCLESIRLVRDSTLNNFRYERLTTLNGNNYFYLRSYTGEVIGTSEIYKNENDMEKNILYLMLNSNSAIIKDYPD